jgi:adenylate cyclase class 2
MIAMDGHRRIIRTEMTQETEIKLALEALGLGVDEARVRIEGLGFAVHKARVFERNLVFDRQGGVLRESRQLLRLRDAGGSATLTYKGGPEEGGKYKSREERETAVGSFAEMRIILERLGYEVTFVYEKYRTEFRETGEGGVITLDETPVGNFMELEGEAKWIDATAKRLGAGEADYLTGSYGRIYVDWCAKNGVRASNMQFSADDSG